MLAGLALLSTVLTGGLLAVTSSSAFATPTGCAATSGGNFAESRCTGGTGEHRVIMRQRHFNPEVGTIDCVGPWVPVGLVSRTPCGFQEVVFLTFEIRESTGAPGTGGPMDNGAPLPQPDPIRVPVPPGMNPPVPVDCFNQLFQDLIIRTRDNASAYVFFVDITVCRNSSGTVIFLGKFSPTISPFEPLLEEIVSISVRSQSDTRLSPSVIVLQAEVVFNVCLDAVNRANCRTFLHNFFGTANDRRGVAGGFTFGEVV
jgi:hypothetical protein